MKILISGASGFVGSSLTRFFTEQNHSVFALVRKNSSNTSNEILWNPAGWSIDTSRLEGFDCVIHLAGENIGDGRWSNEKKARIRDSRVLGTQLLSKALSTLTQKPKVFLSASAIGYYGNRGDEELKEHSPPGKGFLADVALEWELATERAQSSGIRVCNLRFGMILGKGGALAKMLPPFKLGFGGKLGSGEQYISWIAIDDICSIVEFLINKEDIKGGVNVVAPEPVKNKEFTKTLGEILSRPTFASAPAFALRLALGEMADELLLSSTRVLPEKLIKSGYEFKFPKLRDALQKHK